jgi:predicted DNA-binding transcriptional regulator AlpA
MEEQLLTTNKLAEKLGVKPDTLRRALCTNGHYLGIKPVKLPNRRLLWPSRSILRVIDDAIADAVKAGV